MHRRTCPFGTERTRCILLEPTLLIERLLQGIYSLGRADEGMVGEAVVREDAGENPLAHLGIQPHAGQVLESQVAVGVDLRARDHSFSKGACPE